MTINTTLEDITLTKFEKVILATIKGVICDFKNFYGFDNSPVINIVVKHLDNKSDSRLTTFHISAENGSTPVGLFHDVCSILQPFTFGYKFQGGYFPNDGSTSIILQRFDISYETFNGWVVRDVKQQ